MNNNKRRRLLMSGVFLSLLGTVSASRVQLEPGFSTEAAVDMIHAKLYQTIPLPDKQNAEEGERKIAAWLEGVRKKPITRKQFCQLCDRAFNPRLSQVHRVTNANGAQPKRLACLSSLCNNTSARLFQRY